MNCHNLSKINPVPKFTSEIKYNYIFSNTSANPGSYNSIGY